jgi:hypothetical protein
MHAVDGEIVRDLGGRYEDFVQAVRRFRRADLLRLVARVAIHLEDSGQLALPNQGGGITPVTQFSLATVAKECAVRGNDHRSAVPTLDDLVRLCDRYLDASEALEPKAPGSLGRFLIQTAFEQFPWQIPLSEELGRSHALFVEAAHSFGSESIVEDLWQGVLGCSISDYVGAVFVWFVGAMKHGGQVEPEWIDQQNFAPVRAKIDRDTLLSVLAQLKATPVQLREIAASVSRLDSRYRRYEFNPLQTRPVIELGNETLIAPQPLFVIRKATATGLFYEAIAAQGKSFADELGKVFEHYVGLQLRDIPDVRVHDEIVFGKEQERSVDYFIATDETLILVEVKSTRLSAEARVAGPRLVADLQRGLGKAFEQINRSAASIKEGHPDFAHLPRRERLAGLVVTLEPYFVAHTPDIRDFVGQDPGIPTIVSAAREVEHLVAVGQETAVGPVLDAIFVAPRSAEGVFAQLGQTIVDHPAGDNPMLERAWASYPWRGHVP